FFPVEPDAFAQTDIKALLPDSPVIEVEPERKKFTDIFNNEDMRAILEHDLDVALRFGFRILKGDVLGIARHGIWSYHHGDGDVNRGAPPGFWEVMMGEPTTGSMLQVLTEELDNGKVLHRGWAPTTNKFSVRKHINNYYWESSAFVSRKLRELYESRGLETKENGYRPYYNRLYKKPTNTEMIPLMFSLAGRAVHRIREKAYLRDQWVLAYRFKANPADENDVFYKFRYLLPPKDRFWADPFPVKVDGRYYIFFEESTLEPEKGHICVVEIDRNGMKGNPVEVLRNGHHLSYPLVFEWQGSHYMLPETGAKRVVELYRCTSFPDKWEPEQVLLNNVNAYDATLFEDDGRWWMFVVIGEEGVTMPCDELHLFYADSPLGPWQPHRKNPVKTDVRSSRPAGRLFRRHGQLYRPAQDCSKHYGYAITINRVLELSMEDYREEPVSQILPQWRNDLVSTHTLNISDELTVIDCQIRSRKF
ncbi:MAG: hypothetical protein M3R52_13105, partial [Acidobacteriota bacterium]|nr:hypothetical protein [Acidobacteriota bacterium]